MNEDIITNITLTALGENIEYYLVGLPLHGTFTGYNTTISNRDNFLPTITSLSLIDFVNYFTFFMKDY
jgi:hypothetical protein